MSEKVNLGEGKEKRLRFGFLQERNWWGGGAGGFGGRDSGSISK